RFNLIWFLHSDSPFSRERKFALSLSKALSGESLLSTIYRAFPVFIARPLQVEAPYEIADDKARET
ncbi:MAG: hypothetical protein ACLQPN_19585, partial [Bryobacteraceae bacterium]